MRFSDLDVDSILSGRTKSLAHAVDDAAEDFDRTAPVSRNLGWPETLCRESLKLLVDVAKIITALLKHSPHHHGSPIERGEYRARLDVVPNRVQLSLSRTPQIRDERTIEKDVDPHNLEHTRLAQLGSTPTMPLRLAGAQAPSGLAVSPFLSLEFRPAPASSQLRFMIAELLAVHRATGTLRPVASQSWETTPAMDPTRIGLPEIVLAP